MTTIPEREDVLLQNQLPVLTLVSVSLPSPCYRFRVWSCLVTDNFGLFAEIPVCKFLRGWRSYRLKPLCFVYCMCLYIFLQLFARRIVP